MTSVKTDDLDAAAIEAKLPHSGAMSLLDSVTEFGPGRIVTEAISHLDLDNPLRAGEKLPVTAGIEYAAQTVALHGALDGKDGGSPRRGYLAVLSSVIWHTDRLDQGSAPLKIEAVQLVATDNSSQFSFAVSADTSLLLEGSFVVSLEPI